MADFSARGDRYDVIFDAVGKRKSRAAMVNSAAVLAPGGVQMSVDDGFPRMLTSDLLRLKRLAEDGRLRPVIDRVFPWTQVADALRYLERGSHFGKIVLKHEQSMIPRSGHRFLEKIMLRPIG